MERINILSPQLRDSNVNRSDNWEPPIPGLYKLNCDALVFDNGRSAGCGGLLRDSNAFFRFGFAHRLDSCSVLEAELWGVYHGLCIPKNKGYRKLVVNRLRIGLRSSGGWKQRESP